MGTHGQTGGTSMRTPLKDKFPMELDMTEGAQSSHVLAESAPAMTIWRRIGITKLWCWALVPPLSEGIQCPHLSPPWSLDLADAFYNASLQHRVPAAAWESLGITAQPLHCTHHPVKPHSCFNIVPCSFLRQS